MQKIPEFKLKLVREAPGSYQPVKAPEAVVKFCRELWPESQEVVIVLLMDTQHRIIGYNEVARGKVDECAVSSAQIFKAALVSNSSNIIVMHNHPSGSDRPSEDDRRLAHRLEKAAALLEIRLLDFIIVHGPAEFMSFREEGLMPIT